MHVSFLSSWWPHRQELLIALGSTQFNLRLDVRGQTSQGRTVHALSERLVGLALKIHPALRENTENTFICRENTEKTFSSGENAHRPWESLYSKQLATIRRRPI